MLAAAIAIPWSAVSQSVHAQGTPDAAGGAEEPAKPGIGKKRFWNISTQVALDLTGAINFSDPSPSQQIAVRGDIGGFGIAGSSTLSWQLAGIYNYTRQFTGYSISAVGGYRALSTNINFDNGPTFSNLNLVLHGPLIGMPVRF